MVVLGLCGIMLRLIMIINNGMINARAYCLPTPMAIILEKTDIVDHPSYTKASYKKANWQRLAELRQKHDPNGLFFNFDQGLT